MVSYQPTQLRIEAFSYSAGTNVITEQDKVHHPVEANLSKSLHWSFQLLANFTSKAFIPVHFRLSSTMYHINCSEAFQQVSQRFHLNDTILKKICHEKSLKRLVLQNGTGQYPLKTPFLTQNSKLWKLLFHVGGINNTINNIFNFGSIRFMSQICTKRKECAKFITSTKLVGRVKRKFHIGLLLFKNPKCLYHSGVFCDKSNVVQLTYRWESQHKAKAGGSLLKIRFQLEYQNDNRKYSWLEAEEHCNDKKMSLPHLGNEKLTMLFVLDLLEDYLFPTFALFVGLRKNVSCVKSCVLRLV